MVNTALQAILASLVKLLELLEQRAPARLGCLSLVHLPEIFCLGSSLVPISAEVHLAKALLLLSGVQTQAATTPTTGAVSVCFDHIGQSHLWIGYYGQQAAPGQQPGGDSQMQGA